MSVLKGSAHSTYGISTHQDLIHICPRHVCHREEASCWLTLDQSPFVLGLSSENGELLLEGTVQVTEGNKTQERHLFLFKDVIVFAKLK